MLLTPSHDEAAKLAQTLTSLNDERRSEEDRIYKEALEQAEANPKRLGFVLYRKDWHQGVTASWLRVSWKSTTAQC